MEAAADERVAEGQDGKQDVSDDSDSGEVIIELDQSQIASPSDSEEEGEVDRSPENFDKSCENPEASYNKTADSEYFDAVSDIDDLPDDDVKPTPACDKDIAAEPTTEVSADIGKISIDEISAGDGADHLSAASQGPTTAQHSGAAAEDSQHRGAGDSDSWPQASLGLGGVSFKDTLVQENVSQSEEGRTKKSSSVEEVPKVPSNSMKDESIEESNEADASQSQDVSIVKEGATSQENVSSATDVTDPVAMPQAAATAEGMTGAGDLTAGADAVSDVSSDGEVPLSPVPDEDDKPSAEKLSQQAAHQAEVLAPLGAEPVSDPESGEDMGSDESSPAPSPGFGSPIVVTSSSGLSSRGGGGFPDARSRITNRSPGKSNPIASDSVSSLLHRTDRSDRISLEDTAIPAMSSTSNNKLDLSTSLDMENISDDENIGEDNDSDDTSGEIEDEADSRQVEEAVTSSTTQPEEETQRSSAGEKTVNGERVRRPIMIASLGDKQQVQTHFNEEQVELDYEDVDGDGDADGDDGEIKPEDDDDGKEVGGYCVTVLPHATVSFLVWELGLVTI